MIRYCSRWKILTTVVLVVFFCINSLSTPVFLAECLEDSIQQEDSICFFEGYNDLSEGVVDVLGSMESCWPTYGQNNRHTGLSPYPTRDNPMTVKWKFEAEFLGFESSPVIDNDGVLYIGARDSNLYAINPDGTERWRYDLNGWPSESPALAEDGTIYVGSLDNHLYAINPNGSLKWRFNSQDNIIGSSPVIGEDGTIYFGITGPGYDIGRIYALNPDGSEKWHTDFDDYVYNTPTIAEDGTVYVSAYDRYLYALYPENGSVIWKYKTGSVLSTVSIGADGTIYGSCPDDYLYAFYPNGTLRWRTQIDYGSYKTPVIDSDGTIYVGGKYFYAINPDGTMKWTYYGWDNEYEVTSLTFAISSDGLVYFLATRGSGHGGDLFALNCEDGRLFYRRTIAPNGWLLSQPVIDSDGTIYVGSEFQTDETEGYLYAFGAVEDNHAPEKPAISGPRTGKPRQEHTYQFTVEDTDDDEVFLFVDWDDGSNTSWLGPYCSGETVNISHSWMTKDTYAIEACCMDEHEEYGDWTSYPVVMPRMSNNWLESLLMWLINNLQDFLPFNFHP